MTRVCCAPRLVPGQSVTLPLVGLTYAREFPNGDVRTMQVVGFKQHDRVWVVSRPEGERRVTSEPIDQWLARHGNWKAYRWDRTLAPYSQEACHG